jgi:hypothetical protein
VAAAYGLAAEWAFYLALDGSKNFDQRRSRLSDSGIYGLAYLAHPFG